MRRQLSCIVVVMALCACDRRLNPEYCFAHPEDLRCGPPPDAPPPCDEDLDCPGQICDTSASPPVCAECSATNVTLCSAEAPVCSTDRECRGCASDDECPAAVCLPDGTCPTADLIIYVATNGVNTTGCGAIDLPCSITQAIVEATQARSIVKLLPNAVLDYLVSGSTGLAVTKDITLDARGATIRKTQSGAVITMAPGRIFTILGGVVKGGLGISGGHGIVCTMNGMLTVIDTDIGPNEANGIDDTSCGSILVRAVVHNNLIGIAKDTGVLAVSGSSILNNTSGGIEIVGSGTQFTVINNMFWTNGSAVSLTGGISILTDTSTTSRLDFNSFNKNTAVLTTPSRGTAIHCDVAGFTARNNAMFDNGDGANMEQVGGNCQHTYSIALPGTAVPGAGNLAVDPMFISVATGNLRTLPASPTEGAGDPASILIGVAAFDFDGEARTSPPDIGIDEHP